MLITRVDLENVKSYREQSVTFTKGTNAICGANGAGKSTLLEAIGFALFDALPYTQEQFVREGEKVATVTIHLEGSDGRAYQVVRKCGSYAQYYVYDPELDGKVADGKSDTTAWLYAFFGVEETSDMSALFQDAVGVPQGLLTAAFMDRPANRKNTFNPLLRVDEYEAVWQALLAPRRRLEESIAEQETAIAGQEAETKALPGWQEKAAALEGGIATDRARHAALEAELEAVREQREALEGIKERLEALERRAAQADAEVKGIEGRLEDARAAVERAKTAQKVVQGTEAGHQAYVAAQGKLEELEGQRRERDALKENLQTRHADLRLARAALEGLAADLREIAEAETKMAQLGPEVAEQERLEKALGEARIEAEQLAQARRRLTQAEAHLAELEKRLSVAEAGLREREEIEKAIAPLQEKVAAVDERYDALSKQRATHQTELEQIAEQAERARGRLAAAEAAMKREKGDLAELRRKVSEVEQGLAQRGRVEQEIATLEDELRRAERTCRELDAQVATHQAELDQNQGQIGVLEATEAAECPVCHQPLTPTHRAELLAEHHARQKTLMASLLAARGEQEEAEQTRRRKGEALDHREKQLRTLPRTSDREALVANMESQERRVAGSEKARAEAQEEVSRYEGRQQALEGILSALLDEWDDLEEERRQQHEALEGLEERLRALPRAEEVASHAADVSRQQDAVAEGIAEVEAHADAPEKVKGLEAQLREVGDPRSAYHSAAERAAKRNQVEAQQAEVEIEIADLETGIAALEGQLSAFAGLDAHLAEERGRETEHEAAHRRYLEHIREAETVEARTGRVEALGTQLEAAQDAHDRLVEARDQVASEYDDEAYASAVERGRALSDERAKLDERLRLQRTQLAEAASEVARLQEVQRALTAARAERDALQEVQSLLEYLRHVLRDAGPKITQALVEMISVQAARMYADIMADHSARLRWTDDYEILLTASGRERTFQQLSGGEQMAAALATRLALLREVSDIDVAFFDEPTANLDEARRDNLAEQIMNVKGFSQLFVISHDDTFERDTDNVVRVIKENGASRVEG